MTRIDVPDHDVVGIRAENPGPFTLGGTNSWLVGREPAWLVDPGPDLPEHVEELAAEINARGGLGGIALTHDHQDHTEAVPAIRERFPEATLAPGPLDRLPTPGHSPDHVAFIFEDIAFTGDAVLGEGSVFIYPDPGALASYLDGLRALQRRNLRVLCPGHGPIVRDPQSKLEQYIEHRLDRERRLLAALQSGRRTVAELLDEVWDDAPAQLRPAAAVTLAAHLDKLAEEGKLPEGVERPSGWR